MFASIMFVCRKFNIETHSLVGVGNIGSKTWIGALPSLNSIVSSAGSH